MCHSLLSRMERFFISPHTNSTANICETPVCPHSAQFSGACRVTCVCMYASMCHCSCTLCKYVPVSVFSCVRVNACVQISVCNYSDSHGNCPPSLTTKRILILSGLTVPPKERGGGWQSPPHTGRRGELPGIL